MRLDHKNDHKKCWTNSAGFALIPGVRTDGMKTFRSSLGFTISLRPPIVPASTAADVSRRKNQINPSNPCNPRLIPFLVPLVLAFLLSAAGSAAAADATFDFVLKSQSFMQTNAGPAALQTNSPIQFQSQVFVNPTG